MRLSELYKGVIVPMVSPVKADMSIDTDAIHKIVNLFIENGVTPFIIGSTGEAPSLSRAQRIDLLKATVDAVGGKDLIYAGISGNCLADSIAEGELFAEMGADVLVATPTSYYPMTDSQMITYFEALADALPKPLIIYNMPAMTKHNIPVDVVKHLSYHKNIVGLKDSERDEQRLFTLIEMFKDREDFVHLLGWAAMSEQALAKGSAGIVPSTGNITPDLYKQLYDAALAGDSIKADELQSLTNTISAMYQKDRVLSESIPALKAMMSLKDLCTPDVVPPMYRMEPAEEARYLSEVSEALKKMNLL